MRKYFFLMLIYISFESVQAQEPKVIPDQWEHQGKPVYFTVEMNGRAITDSTQSEELNSIIQSFLRGNREPNLAVDTNGNVLYTRSLLVPKFYYKAGDQYSPFGSSDQAILLNQWRQHARSLLGKPVAAVVTQPTKPKGIAKSALDLSTGPTTQRISQPLAIAAPRPVVESRPIKGVMQTEPDPKFEKKNIQKQVPVGEEPEPEIEVRDCKSFKIEEKSPGESVLSYAGADKPVALAEILDIKTFACSGNSIALMVLGFRSYPDLHVDSQVVFSGDRPMVVVIEANALVLVRASTRLNYEWLETDRNSGWFRVWYENERNMNLLIAPNAAQIKSALYVEPMNRKGTNRRTEP